MFEGAKFNGDISAWNLSDSNLKKSKLGVKDSAANNDVDNIVVDNDVDDILIKDPTGEEVNIVLFKRKKFGDTFFYQLIENTDDLAKKLSDYMKQYDFISEGVIKERSGVISFDITSNSDFKDGEGFIMSENYLKKTIFDKVKAFCKKEKVSACASFIAHGYIGGYGCYGSICAFVTSSKINCSWATVEECPKSKIKEIMDKENCNKKEARKKLINSDDFLPSIYFELEDCITDSFIDDHKHDFLETLYRDILDEIYLTEEVELFETFEDFCEDVNNKGKCYQLLKEKKRKISALFDRNPWPFLFNSWSE
jgi:hypothetical protein